MDLTIFTRYRQAEQDAEAELHILDCYLAILEARVAAERTRTAADALLAMRFPRAVHVPYHESIRMAPFDQPEQWPYVVIDCPDKYVIHRTLNGRLGAVIDCIRFEVN